MTFAQIVADVCGRMNLVSAEAIARVGQAVNRHHRRVTASLGLETTRYITRSALTTLASDQVTFTGMEKVDRVFEQDADGTVRVLDPVSVAQLRESQRLDGSRQQYAIWATTTAGITILLPGQALAIATLWADGWTTLPDLTGTDQPVFPASFHDILTFEVTSEEYLRKGNTELSDRFKLQADVLLKELRFALADAPARDFRQADNVIPGAGGGGTGGSGSSVITGDVTFDRDPGPPFHVTAGSALVENLDADKLDGQHGAFYQDASNLNAGTVPPARMGPPIPHAPSHANGSSDPVDVKALSGFNNDPTTFLRGDHVFAVPPGGGGGALPTDATGKVLISQGAGVTPIYSNKPLLVGSDSALTMRDNPTSREFKLAYNEAAGAAVLSRSDAPIGLALTFPPDGVALGPTSTGGGNEVINIVAAGGRVVVTPTNAGGAGKVQFGRRMSDSHPAVGASVECWAATGQTEPVLETMAPGGASKTFWIDPDGKVHAPTGFAPDTPLPTTAPGGVDKQIQFNDGGAFGGDAGLTYDKATDALTVAGGVVLTNGRLQFPSTQVPSADANTLDDYREGAWSPQIGGSGGASGQFHSISVGRYIKVGKLVTAWGRVALNTLGTIVGNVQISGLPFPADSLINFYGDATISYWGGLSRGFVYLVGQVPPGLNSVVLIGAPGAAAVTLQALIQTDLTATSDFIFKATYQAQN